MADARAIFVGDTQGTLLLERLIGREDNSAERARLLGLVAELDAEAAIFLGDLVARQSARAWTVVDACLTRLRALLIEAMAQPKLRRKTRPTRASKERRLESKKQRSETKRRRSSADD